MGLFDNRFSCLVLGWRDDNDPLVRMGNPSLQVLYDDVLVFDLGTAIRDNDAKFALKRWNQFRLMSRYFLPTWTLLSKQM